jgi:hypothetical protein
MSNPGGPATAAAREKNRLEQAINELAARLEEVSTSRAGSSKGQKPNPFDGKVASQLPEFLFQMRITFEARTSDFPTDKSKILYAASFLRGLALAYVEPYFDKRDSTPWMNDFALFAKELTRVFGDPDRRGNETYKLRHLKQTGSASAYAAEFQRLACRLAWNDEALVSQFFDGLKDAVQDELIKIEYPEKLNEIIPLAIRIDNLQHHRASRRSQQAKHQTPMQRRHQPAYVTSKPRPFFPNQPAPAPAMPATANSGPRPMELGATRTAYPRLTEKQREYRRKNNLCMYCGEPGHVVHECPVRPKPRPRHAHIAGVTAIGAHDPGKDHAQTPTRASL